MKKIIVLFFIFIFLSTLVNATQIWTNDAINITTFREKVDIYKGVIDGKEVVRAKITDIFAISIPKEKKEEKIFLVIMPTRADFSNPVENISEVSIIGCGAGNHHLNYSLDKTFGLSCLKEIELNNSDIQETTINHGPLLEFNASKFNWKEFLNGDNSKTVYISASYIIDNLVVEASSYSTLWIRKVECYYQSPNCLSTYPAIYVSIPSYFFLNGGYNYQMISIDKKDGNIVVISKNPDDDIVLSYQDTKKAKWEELKWFIFGIFISFLFSLVATKFGELPEAAFFAVLLVFIFVLIILGSITFGISPSVPIIIYFIFLFFLLLMWLWNYFIEGNGVSNMKKLYKKFKEEIKKDRIKRYNVH